MKTRANRQLFWSMLMDAEKGIECEIIIQSVLVVILTEPMGQPESAYELMYSKVSSELIKSFTSKVCT
jgi:hypothetical protein